MPDEFVQEGMSVCVQVGEGKCDMWVVAEANGVGKKDSVVEGDL